MPKRNGFNEDVLTSLSCFAFTAQAFPLANYGPSKLFQERCFDVLVSGGTNSLSSSGKPSISFLKVNQFFYVGLNLLEINTKEVRCEFGIAVGFPPPISD